MKSVTPILFSWEDIYNSSLQLLFPLNIDETYKIIVEEAKKLLHAKHGTIVRNENGKLKRVYATSRQLLSSYVSQNGRTKKAIDLREPFIFHVTKPTDIHDDLPHLKVKSILFIPLSYENHVVGVLNMLFDNTISLSAEHMLMLKLFGSLISQAIYKAEEYKKTEEAVLVRDLFIAMASHELKTPLTSIMLYAEMVKRQTEKGTLPSLPYIENLLKQAKWLSQLTNDILQANSIKNRQLHYTKEKISLAQVIELAINSSRMSYTKYTIKFKNALKRKQAFVYGDFYKLLQVITNIMNNAVKFSPEGSAIEISLQQKNKNFCVIIKDQGTGIAKKDLPKIFEGFYKGGHKQQEGMGLGLYLVKEILNQHHGSITINSQSKKGTTVTISLPKYAR